MPKSRVAKTANLPGGGKGWRVTDEKYAPVKEAILRAVPRGEEGITFADLLARVADDLKKRRVPKALFPTKGSLMWYAKVVQLDLETRGLIARVRGSKPLRFRRMK
jgi:hypothetical protein